MSEGLWANIKHSKQLQYITIIIFSITFIFFITFEQKREHTLRSMYEEILDPSIDEKYEKMYSFLNDSQC